MDKVQKTIGSRDVLIIQFSELFNRIHYKNQEACKTYFCKRRKTKKAF
jgi:hypothetical protein